jgi:hypothetical protein
MNAAIVDTDVVSMLFKGDTRALAYRPGTRWTSPGCSPAAADARDIRVEDLVGRMELKPGELRIEFYGAEDLAAKLFELSQAMANDWQAFARAVEEEARSGRAGDGSLSFANEA